MVRRDRRGRPPADTRGLARRRDRLDDRPWPHQAPAQGVATAQSGCERCQHRGHILMTANRLTFGKLSRVNLARCRRWHPGGLAEWSPSDWAVAMAGEAG